MRLAGIIPALAIAATAALPQTHAAERVTLTNGFVESCNHHANVDSHVRLFLNAAEDSYIDFAPTRSLPSKPLPIPNRRRRQRLRTT